MPLATLSIDIVAQLAKMQEGLDKATHLNEKAAADIEARWNKLHAGAVELGRAIASAFAVHEIVAFTRETIDAIDALNDAKDATGATVENLSALEDVARRNGGTLDDVTGILVKFNGALKDADGKNTVSQAIKAIGLNAEELRRLDPAEALQRVAVALSGFADDGNKARVVQELFGKSIREAAPFLNDLAQAGKLNATITSQQAAEAEKFNKQLFALQTDANNMARGLVNDLVPAINSWAAALKGVKTEQTELSATGSSLRTFLETITILGGNVKYVFTEIGNEIGGIGAQLAAAARGDFAGFAEIHRMMVEDAAAARKELDEWEKRILDRSGGGGGSSGAAFNDRRFENARPPSLPDHITVADKKNIENAIREAKDYYKQQFLKSEKGAYDQTFELPVEFVGPPVDAQQLAATRQAIQDINQALASTPSGQLRQLEDLLATLQNRAAYGGSDPKEAAEAIQGITDAITRIKAEQGDLGAALKQNLGSDLRKALHGDWAGILQDWEQLILEMIAKATEAEILKRVFGQGSGAGGSWGDLFKFILGSANGNAFDSRGVVPFANGGVVNSATLFGFGDQRMGVMGEAGPEAVVPLKRGRDGKLGISGGGGYIDASIGSLHVGSNVSLAEVRAVVNQALAAQEARFMRLRNEGRF